MRTLLPAAAAAVAAALALAATGQAQSPNAAPVTLKTSAATVTFSTPVTLTGSVKGEKGGVTVALERRATTSSAFVPAATAVTDSRATSASASARGPTPSTA